MGMIMDRDVFPIIPSKSWRILKLPFPLLSAFDMSVQEVLERLIN